MTLLQIQLVIRLIPTYGICPHLFPT
jgi:hypothetical protein